VVSTLRPFQEARAVLRTAAALSSLLVLGACNWFDTFGGPTIKGSGTLKSETRPVEKFTAINLSAAANLEIEQTGQESLELTADDNLLPLFTSQVRDGTLYLAIAEGKSVSGEQPRFRVTVSELRKLNVSSAASVKATKLDSNALSISVSAGASGSIAGRSDNLTISVSGNGTVNAVDLQAKRAKVVVRGIGDVTVNATNEIDASVIGIGTFSYIDQPNLNWSVFTLGFVSRKTIPRRTAQPPMGGAMSIN
jgi:hypothetical protein